MLFKDRTEAGKVLAEKLESYRDSKPIVYALPRGGAVIGAEIAKHLKAPLDLIITRKVGHPNWAEYAICAVGEVGQPVCNPDEVNLMNEEWLDMAIEREREEAKRRREMYLANRSPVNSNGKTAIITDDGIATGLTMAAAINQIMESRPLQVIVAVPVAPWDVVAKLQHDYGIKFVVLDSSEPFLGAVGAYYSDFRQVSDDEVIAILKQLP